MLLIATASLLLLLPATPTVGAAATPSPWQPSAKCQAVADAACNSKNSSFGPHVDHGHSCWVDIRSRPCDGPMVARKSGPGEPLEWRCYSPSTLAPRPGGGGGGGRNFSKGTCFCTLDSQLRALLAACGSPDPSPPPTPPPPPAPAQGGVTVFQSGAEGYHTYRIPAVVANPGGLLLCFCEGRKFSSSDHDWNDIVLKKSTDGGASWGPLKVVWGESTPSKHVTIGNPAPVAVGTQPGKVVLVGCRENVQVFVMTSLDFGTTWSKPRYLTAANPPHGKNGSWPWVATGPPAGLQLPGGRLLVASDHRGFPASNHALVFSHSMYSDDLGVTWELSNSIPGGNECERLYCRTHPRPRPTAAALTVLRHLLVCVPAGQAALVPNGTTNVTQVC
jgi:hypothetical protein